MPLPVAPSGVTGGHGHAGGLEFSLLTPDLQRACLALSDAVELWVGGGTWPPRCLPKVLL